MDRTPASLLQQVRQPTEHAAWKRFVHLYTPLLYQWARRLGLQEPDAADLVQDVFIVLVRKLPQFEYDPQKSFRAWLKTLLLNKWREHRRRRLPLSLDTQGNGLADPSQPEDPDGVSEAEYREQLVRRALQLLRPELQPITWEAFREYVLDGRAAAEVARTLGISVNAVYIAKSRVLRRLRRELEGLMD